ncbi:hypothetical protein [Halobacteriaceae bacterium SHR40]|uniref:hypothetical protein n=1 Tax=Halovenus amylolytica TaxID=2500550 RepID=UPI000FE2CF1D
MVTETHISEDKEVSDCLLTYDVMERRNKLEALVPDVVEKLEARGHTVWEQLDVYTIVAIILSEAEQDDCLEITAKDVRTIAGVDVEDETVRNRMTALVDIGFVEINDQENNISYCFRQDRVQPAKEQNQSEPETKTPVEQTKDLLEVAPTVTRKKVREHFWVRCLFDGFVPTPAQLEPYQNRYFRGGGILAVFVGWAIQSGFGGAWIQLVSQFALFLLVFATGLWFARTMRLTSVQYLR